MQFKMPHKSMM